MKKILFALALVAPYFSGMCHADSMIHADSMNHPNSTEKLPSGEPFDLNPSLAPLLSADGAEAGLRGCLNRGLYVNGPHKLITTVLKNASTPYWDRRSSETQVSEYEYKVLKVSAGGVSEVDVSTKITRSSTSSVISLVRPYLLEGHQLRVVGHTRNTPNPYAYVNHFDLKPGEEVTQTINAGPDASPNLFTRVDTYMGREEIAIAGRAVKACRIDSVVTSEALEPQFRRWGFFSTWYALGTGLELRVESTSNPDSEQDTLLETKVLTAAELNGVKLF